jgi:hypothetical protein
MIISRPWELPKFWLCAFSSVPSLLCGFAGSHPGRRVHESCDRVSDGDTIESLQEARCAKKRVWTASKQQDFYRTELGCFLIARARESARVKLFSGRHTTANVSGNDPLYGGGILIQALRWRANLVNYRAGTKSLSDEGSGSTRAESFRAARFGNVLGYIINGLS